MTNKNQLCPRRKAGASLVRHKGTFSYDSKLFLVPSATYVKVFSCASGERVSVFTEHRSEVVSVVRNPENQVQALSCSDDGVVLKWDPSDGAVLKKHDVSTLCSSEDDPKSKVASFYAPPSFSSWFVLRQTPGASYGQLESVPIGGGEGQVLSYKVTVKSSSPVAFSPAGGLCASICRTRLTIAFPGSPSRTAETFLTRGHKNGVKFTCVAGHPSEPWVATGDSLGRVTVWQDFKDTSPVRSVYHWHTLPVADLAYTSSGRFLLSGGGECVLVKWSLPSGDRQFVPRMGLPICHVVNSPDATLTLTAHTDNCLRLVSSQLRVVRQVQGLALWQRSSAPVLLLHDTRTATLVLRGQPGQLQFYQPQEDKQLFCLDVVGQNYMTQERDGGIVNTEVVLAALAGDWLLTVEHWADNSLGPETRLKFWRFDHMLQNFVLDTSVYAPHNGHLHDLQLHHPSHRSDRGGPLALTTAEDRKFRLWAPLQPETPPSQKSDSPPQQGKEASSCLGSWNCIGSGSFRSFPACKGSISQDGSLLAVGFARSATLWSEDCVLRAALAHPHCPDSITALSFGQGPSCHLLTSCTQTKLVVWDVVSLSVMWELDCTVTCLVPDVSSGIMAAFCDSNSVMLFEPKSWDSVRTGDVPADCQPVTSAAFFPDNLDGQDSLLRLYFLSAQQELYTWDEEAKEETGLTGQKVKLDAVLPATPFGALVAQESRSAATTDAPEQQRLGLLGFREVHQLLEVPSHTLPPMTSLYQNLLSAFLTKNEHTKSTKADESEDEEAMSQHGSDSDADMEVDQVPAESKTEESPQVEPECFLNCAKLAKVKQFAWLATEDGHHTE